MPAAEFPIEDFIPRVVTVNVGPSVDFSEVPPSSKIFENQSWHEAAAVLDSAEVNSIRPVHLLVGETPENGSVGARNIDEDADEGTVTLLLQPELEVLPVGPPKFYDTDTGQRIFDDESSEAQPSDDDDEPNVSDEVGLYRVEKGGLQASAAIVIEQAMVMAYIAGRLDQANQGTNRERLIRARDLGIVAANAEWLSDTPAHGRHGERARRIVQKAIQKFGSVSRALEIDES